MSSGCAECPDDDTTYLGFPSPFSAIMEGGKDVGTERYVYGKVTAVGSDRKGETVNGTCASNG